MSSLVKYRIREVAADFGMTPKEVSEIVGKYFEKPKSNTQVLEDAQLNVVFEYITRQNQVASLEQVVAATAKDKRPAPAAERKARGQAARRPGAGHGKPSRCRPSSRRRSPRSRSASASAASSTPLPSPSTPTALTTASTPSSPSGQQNYSGGKQQHRQPQLQKSRSKRRASTVAPSHAPRSRRRCAASSWRSPRRPR